MCIDFSHSYFQYHPEPCCKNTMFDSHLHKWSYCMTNPANSNSNCPPIHELRTCASVLLPFSPLNSRIYHSLFSYFSLLQTVWLIYVWEETPLIMNDMMKLLRMLERPPSLSIFLCLLIWYGDHRLIFLFVSAFLTELAIVWPTSLKDSNIS